MIPLLKGLLLGFSIGAPVGPIGILCMRRTLTLGRLHGFLSGLGAATADAIYGFIAGFGLTLITSFLLAQKVILQLVGVFAGSALWWLLLSLLVGLFRERLKRAAFLWVNRISGAMLSVFGLFAITGLLFRG
nr:hypothetical protein [Paenibacillus sp. Soil766]